MSISLGSLVHEGGGAGTRVSTVVHSKNRRCRRRIDVRCKLTNWQLEGRERLNEGSIGQQAQG